MGDGGEGECLPLPNHPIFADVIWFFRIIRICVVVVMLVSWFFLVDGKRRRWDEPEVFVDSILIPVPRTWGVFRLAG